MKEKLLSHDDVRHMHPLFEGKYGKIFTNWTIKFTGVDKANAIYDRSKHLTGPAFCTDLLDNLGMRRVVINGDILEARAHTPFITVSNHPCGHVDGIALIETVGARVENFKIMVNQFLGLIDTMSQNFITVDPHQGKNMRQVTMQGFRACVNQIKSGNQLGFFPSGAVSNLFFRNGKFGVIDREWQLSIIKLIQRSGVPVIPIHIAARNSFRFYASKIFGWKTRSMMQCHDLYNKKGKEMTLTVGEPITAEEIAAFKDVSRLGEFLKAKTYGLSGGKYW